MFSVMCHSQFCPKYTFGFSRSFSGHSLCEFDNIAISVRQNTLTPLFVCSGFSAKVDVVGKKLLGSVHYLYPGLVPKRNGLGKPFFWSVKGWVISVLKKA